MRSKKKVPGRFFKEYLEKGEKIQYILRRHPLTMHVEMAKIKFLFILLPILLWFFFPITKPLAIVLLIFGVWKLVDILLDWYYNVWLITDMGVVSIKGNAYWSIKATRIEYHMIEGITYSISGFWHVLLNYGDIMLEKIGGGKTVVTLNDACNPREAESAILKCQKAHLNHRYVGDHQELKKLLLELVQGAA